MPVTRVGVQAVTGSPGQIVDIDPARISATITNVGTVAVEYSTGGAWTAIAAGGAAFISCDTHDLRLRRTGSGAYPAPVDIDWTAQSEGEANSLTALQAATVSGAGIRDSAVIASDSWGQYNYAPLIPSGIVDNGDGTATITGASLGIYQGDTIAVGGMATPRLNQLQATVLSATIVGGAVTSATYATNGLFVNQPQSGGPFLHVPWRESDQGWWHMGCKLAGVAPTLLANFSSGGADSEQLEALLPAIIALRPRACFIQLGTNNVYARNWAADRTIASLKRFVDALAGAGIIPVLGAIPPRSNGDQSAANAARTAPANAWAAKYLPRVGGYFIQHWAASASGVALADPTSAVGLAGANMLGDGVHPARPYAFGYGKSLVSALRSIYNRVPALTPADVTASGKLWGGNPMLTGTSGTMTAGSGTVAAVPAWAGTTLYAAGKPVIAGGRLYVATAGGTSSGAAPTHTAGTATDGTVTWLFLASGAVAGVPTGVTVANSVGSQNILACIIPRTEAMDGDAAGNKLRLFITDTTAGSNVLVRMSETPGNWDYADRMSGRCGIQVSSSATPGSGAPVAMTTPQLEVTTTTTITGTDRAFGPAVQIPGIQIDEGYTMQLRTTPRAPKAGGAAIHGSLSFIRLDLQLFFRGVGSAAVDIWHPCIEVIDPTLL